MKMQRDSGWARRGFSLLWDARALSKVVSPSDVVSIREFFAMTKAWPEELPGAGGDALVVTGVEGCLDALSDDDGKAWLETDVKRAVLSFQEEYEGQAALILWLPSGRRRVSIGARHRGVLLEEQLIEEYAWASDWPMIAVHPSHLYKM